MRLLCPHCQQAIAVPDSAAEQPTPCPLCGHIFTPPALLDAPPPPPMPPIPPPPMSAAMPKPPAEDKPKPVVATPADYRHTAGFSLRLEVVRWFAPVGLVLALILTGFAWVGAYPGGTAVYTQNAWQAAAGTFSTDIGGNEALENREPDLEKNSGFGGWMILYLLLLLPAVALAVGDLVMPLVTMAIPPTIQQIWVHRLPLLTLLALVTLLLLMIPVVFGFSLEKAAVATVDVAVRAPADAPVENSKQRLVREVKRGSQLASYSLQRTTWLELALLAHIAAAAGAGLELWLLRRGQRPGPRLDVQW